MKKASQLSTVGKVKKAAKTRAPSIKRSASAKPLESAKKAATVKKVSTIKAVAAKKQVAKSAKSDQPAVVAKKLAAAGIVGLSTEKGVFLVVAVEQGAEELFDFRLAVKEPFPRAINVGASKCRRATTVVQDASAQPPRQLYLAFIAVPTAAELEGNLLYRARNLAKQEVFFQAPTQKFQSFEADKLTRLLAALSEGFAELLPSILGKDHPLTVQTQAILKKKAELEFWNATQQKVKDLLQQGQGPQALSVLEPLVYVAKPHAQAEKLLGDLLYSSAKKPQAPADGPGQQALKTLATETLLLQWFLKKHQLDQADAS